MSREKIFAQIEAERSYQDAKWGTAFDDKNTVNDWVVYIGQYAGDAARMNIQPQDSREKLLKVAALAVAALETFDRNGGFAARHYGQ